MAMTPETRVKNKILDYLKQLVKEDQPIFFERRQAGGFSYKKGIPDIYAVINGTHLEIEVKKPGGELSAMQEKFRDMCKRKNICWICVENISELKQMVINLLP